MSSLYTVVPSGCHRTIIRWLHDGIARASCSRVAFRRQSDSFLFPSYCLRKAIHAKWHRWSPEVKTKMKRLDKMPSRWPYEGQHGHRNSLRKRTFATLPEPEKSTGGHTMASDALTDGPIRPDVFTTRAEFEHFLHRVSIRCQLRDSVTRA